MKIFRTLERKHYYPANRRLIPGRRSGRKVLRTALLLLTIVLILWASLPSRNVWQPTSRVPLNDSVSSPAPQGEPSRQLLTKYYAVEPGDTLSAVCRRFGVPAERLGEWQQSFPEFEEVSRLMPGDEFTFFFRGPSPKPVKLVYSPIASPTDVVFQKKESGWECRKKEVELETVVKSIRGAIAENLFTSATEAGLSAGLVLELADLFAYDIDFNTDLQKGDTFRIHFEQQMKEEKTMGPGRILAAEMQVGGQLYQAFYFEFPDGHKGYFDASGDSLQKLFLKSPLSFSRISSTFTHKRLHPILKTVRPHLGIDYAAPTGTPVSALGNGTVTFLGNKGGFGRCVEVKHNRTYKTGYAHLSRFAKGLKVGSKVAQGEVIGYVGSTGLATGPHLDFRFYENGKPVNFLETRFPRAESIPQTLRADFEKRQEIYLAGLEMKHLVEQEDEALNDQKTSSIVGWVKALIFAQKPITSDVR